MYAVQLYWARLPRSGGYLAKDEKQAGDGGAKVAQGRYHLENAGERHAGYRFAALG
jgi:hypothetical protein